jgi:hypothetical protein
MFGDGEHGLTSFSGLTDIMVLPATLLAGLFDVNALRVGVINTASPSYHQQKFHN